eukprot:2164714-Alexandrium_andersonii.AAC.1
MSASLVGSEMCIRDRHHGCLPPVGSVPPARAWCGSGGAFGGGLVRGGCVPPRCAGRALCLSLIHI